MEVVQQWNQNKWDKKNIQSDLPPTVSSVVVHICSLGNLAVAPDDRKK